MLFLQGKWPGCVHYHVSAIPGERCLMRRCITYIICHHCRGVLPPRSSSPIWAKTKVLFLQGKWPGCVHHHVSAIPGGRCLMRRCITHIIRRHCRGVLPPRSSSPFWANWPSVVFEVLTMEMAGRVAFGEKVRLYFSKERRKNNRSCY